MNSRTWKKYEQTVAEEFGMKRALQKGTKTKEDIAPEEGVDAAPWIVDAKLRKNLSVWRWMEELVEYARAKDKPPILVFREFPKRQSYAVLEQKWFFSNFEGHIQYFSLQPWSKMGRRNFNKAWKETRKICGTNRIPGLLMGITQGDIDYVCIKFENLISLMKAKGMLKGENDGEV